MPAIRGKFDRSAGQYFEFFRSPLGIGLPGSLINWTRTSGSLIAAKVRALQNPFRHGGKFALICHFCLGVRDDRGADEARDQMEMQMEHGLACGSAVELLEFQTVCPERCNKLLTDLLDGLEKRAKIVRGDIEQVRHT